MANQANRIAGMPGPCSVNMPGFSEDGTVAFPDFLHKYEALARANGLTNLQKVESIVRYVSLELRRFWRSLDGFDPPLWNTFHAALVDMYPDTSAATRVTKRNLRELIRKSREYRMRDEEDVMRYYRQFLKLTNPLRTTGSLSDESRNTKFFKGFHHEDREVLSSRIFSMHPNHPRDTPYELKDVFKAARDYFSNAQFYRPIQRRLYDDDEAGYNSDSDSDPDSDSGLNHQRTTNSRHRGRDDNDRRNRDSRRGNDRYEFDSHRDRGLSDRRRPNDSRERDSRRDHPRHDARNHDHSRDRSPQHDPPASAVQTRTVRFKQQDEDREMEDLLSRLHGLNIREQAYALLHGQLRRHWPLVANDYPKPELPSVSVSPATYAYQAPPPPVIPTAPLQWPQMAAPPPVTTSSQQGESPDS